MHGEGEPDNRDPAGDGERARRHGRRARRRPRPALQLDAAGAPAVTARDARSRRHRRRRSSAACARRSTASSTRRRSTPATSRSPSRRRRPCRRRSRSTTRRKSIVLKPGDVLEATRVYTAHLGTGVQELARRRARRRRDLDASPPARARRPASATATPAAGATGVFDRRRASRRASTAARTRRRVTTATLHACGPPRAARPSPATRQLRRGDAHGAPAADRAPEPVDRLHGRR